MIDPMVLLTFVPVALALNLTPGADMMLCVAQAMKHDSAAGCQASAGVAVGGMIHGLIAGLGLATLVAAAPLAFEAIRWIGAAYLIWMAWQALQDGHSDTIAPRRRPAFRDGLIVNLTNPKYIVFVLAFVPQFTDPAQALLPQFLIFSAILSTGGFFINSLAAVLAGTARGRLTGRLSRGFQYLSAAVFAGLALRLVFLERS